MTHQNCSDARTECARTQTSMRRWVISMTVGLLLSTGSLAFAIVGSYIDTMGQVRTQEVRIQQLEKAADETRSDIRQILEAVKRIEISMAKQDAKR